MKSSKLIFGSSMFNSEKDCSIEVCVYVANLLFFKKIFLVLVKFKFYAYGCSPICSSVLCHLHSWCTQG